MIPAMTRARGFTLLELLVAVAVLGMLIVLLNQGVQFGLRATAMQGRTDERQGDLEAVDRALRQIVQRADPGPSHLQGTATTLTLITELPNPTTGIREPVEASLALTAGQLRLRWRPRRHVQPFGPPSPASDLVLLTGLGGLQFDYAGTNGWLPTWTTEGLPLLVRIKFVFADTARHWPPIIIAPQRDAPER